MRLGRIEVTSRPRIPPYHRCRWPALQATKSLGGSATVREMTDLVIVSEGYSEEEQAVPHGDGRMSEIEYRLHWARTHLKGIGALANSTRGVWTVTEHGNQLTEAQMHAETKAWRAQVQQARRSRAAQVQRAVTFVTEVDSLQQR